MFSNNIQFDSDGFGSYEDAFKRKMQIHWVPVNLRVTIENTFRIEESRVRYNDKWLINLKDFKNSAFQVIKYGPGPYIPYNDYTDGRTTDYVLS